ncbi:hypothetical protein [Streptosporangium canum]|uniref:hypothetical protein n=1 Tax=Streptosporangium canum TaxID=324952 RepID=UPI0037930ACA
MRAVVDGIADGFEPETFLWLTFRRPDGGASIRYAWTGGGQPLGDHIDRLAVAAGCDAADWLHIAERHQQTTARGRVEIWAYALRPMLADVQSGARGPQERRESLARVLATAAEIMGQRPRTLIPRWLGFGPALLQRND